MTVWEIRITRLMKSAFSGSSSASVQRQEFSSVTTKCHSSGSPKMSPRGAWVRTTPLAVANRDSNTLQRPDPSRTRLTPAFGPQCHCGKGSSWTLSPFLRYPGKNYILSSNNNSLSLLSVAELVYKA